MKVHCSSEYETEIFVLSKLSMGLERSPQIGMFENSKHRKNKLWLLPLQGFGPEAKTRGGTLGVPACIHIRNFKM